MTRSGTVEILGDLDRPGSWVLLVDGTPQSHVDLGDPEHLEFEYVRRIGHLVDLAAPAGHPLRVLHLGGGGLTVARYVAATRPGSGQLAVESDAALADLVRRRLPWRAPGGRSRAAGVRVRIADARAVVEQARPQSFDMIIADVFVGARTPAHLTSVELDRAVARALAPSGSYVVNIGDGPPLAHARSRVATAAQVFDDVCLTADAAVLRGRRFGNLVLAASARELPVAALTRRAAADPFPGRVLHGAELDRFVAGARPITDALARPSPAPPADVFAGGRKPRALG